jgi:hypothetical protein
MISALGFAYPEYDFVADLQTWTDITKWIDCQEQMSMLFILDGWDYFVPSTDTLSSYEVEERRQQRLRLEALTLRHSRVEGCTSISACSIDDESDVQVYTMSSGLNNEEWADWVASKADTQQMPPQQQEEPQEQQRESKYGSVPENKHNNGRFTLLFPATGKNQILEALRDFTGGVPALLYQVAAQKGSTLLTKQRAFEASRAGQVIVSDLRSFARAFLRAEKKHLLQDYLSLMREAHLPASQQHPLSRFTDRALLDQRYFYYEEGCVVAISTFVANTIRFIILGMHP